MTIEQQNESQASDVRDGAVEQAEHKPSKIRILHLDHLTSILGFLPAHTIPNLMRVSKLWRTATSDPLLWREYCFSHFGNTKWTHNRMKELGSWYETFKQTPLVRYDGAYILKHATYRMRGQSIRMDGNIGKIIEHAYWRYVRFHPNNVVEYATFNLDPEKHPIKRDRITKGIYRWRKSGRVQLKVAMSHLTVFVQLDLTETWKGAHNRLYFDKFQGQSTSVSGETYTDNLGMDEWPWRFYPDFDDWAKDLENSSEDEAE